MEDTMVHQNLVLSRVANEGYCDSRRRPWQEVLSGRQRAALQDAARVLDR
jgi:hypothetical protein